MRKALGKTVLTLVVVATLSLVLWKSYQASQPETPEQQAKRLQADAAAADAERVAAQAAARAAPQSAAPPPHTYAPSPYHRLNQIQSYAEENTGVPSSFTQPAQLLAGHTGLVHAIKIAPDGKRFASAGSDRTIKLWDLATGKLLKSLEGPAEIVQTLAFSSDGSMIATGQLGGGVEVLNANTGEILAVFAAHPIGTDRVLFLPGDKGLITAGCDGSIRTWKIDGTPQLNVPAHSSCVFALDVRPDGKQALSGSVDKTAALVDLETGAVNALPGVTAQVQWVNYIDQGRKALVYQLNEPTLVYDLETQQVIDRIDQRGGNNGAVTDDGATAMITQGSSARVWSIVHKTPITQCVGPKSVMWGVDMSADGRYVVGAGGFDARDPNTRQGALPTIYVWDLGAQPRALAAGITAVAGDPAGKHLFYAVAGGELHDLKAPGGPIARGQGKFSVLSADAAGENIACADASGIHVYARGSGKETAHWPLAGAGALCWLNPTTVAASVGNQIYLCPIGGSAKLLGKRDKAITALAAMNDNDRLAASTGHEVSVWSASGQWPGLQFTLDRPGDGEARSLLGSPDGQRMFMLDSVCGLLAFDGKTSQCVFQGDSRTRNFLALLPGPDTEHLLLQGPASALLDLGTGVLIDGLPGMGATAAAAVYPGPGSVELVDASGRASAGSYLVPRMIPFGDSDAEPLQLAPSGAVAVRHSRDFKNDYLVLCDLRGDAPPRKIAVPLDAAMANQHVVIALSADGTAGALATTKGAHVVDLQTGAPRGQLIDAQEAIDLMALSPDGTRLATSTGDRPSHAALWNVATGEKIADLAANTLYQRLVFSPDGKFLAASTQLIPGIPSDPTPNSRPRGVWLFDGGTGKALGSVPAENRTIIATLFKPDSSGLYIIDENGGVQLFNTQAMAVDWKRDYPSRLARVALSPEGSKLLIGAARLTLWDVESGAMVAGPPTPSTDFSVFYQGDVPAMLTHSSDRGPSDAIGQLFTWKP